MIQGFYFRFYRMTKIEWLSAVLSYLAYSLFMCKYVIERIFCKKKIITMKKDEALAIVNKVHPDCGRQPICEPCDVDDSIDLSVIVPVYNYVDLIENNILSILNQKTEYKFELILVDDGSTDGAQDILRKYEDHPQVNVIFQKNQGIAGARNTGLNHAKGKYIMFVDCDDTTEPNLIETLMKRACQDDCDIVMCAHNLVKERNGEIYEIVPNIYPGYNLLGYSGNAKILNYAGLPWCKVYKRELWDKVRYFPGYWYEDTIIHSLLFTQSKKFAYEKKFCYQYRWYEKNFSHTQGDNVNPKTIDQYWILLKILEKFDELKLRKDECFKTMLIKHLSAYYYPTFKGLDENVIGALFARACDIYEEYCPKKDIKLPYMLRVTEKALQKRDINLWKLATKYQ